MHITLYHLYDCLGRLVEALGDNDLSKNCVGMSPMSKRSKFSSLSIHFRYCGYFHLKATVRVTSIGNPSSTCCQSLFRYADGRYKRREPWKRATAAPRLKRGVQLRKKEWLSFLQLLSPDLGRYHFR
eukprot:scpid96713/ scgid20352/ 